MKRFGYENNYEDLVPFRGFSRGQKRSSFEWDEDLVPGFNNFWKNINNNFEIKLTQNKKYNLDGTVEIENSIFCTPKKTNERKIIDVKKETRNILIKDYKIEYQTKSFKTGIIFKDTHYYQIQKVIPLDHYQKQERTVTYYSDGTISYGDWRNIS